MCKNCTTLPHSIQCIMPRRKQKEGNQTKLIYWALKLAFSSFMCHIRQGIDDLCSYAILLHKLFKWLVFTPSFYCPQYVQRTLTFTSLPFSSSILQQKNISATSNIFLICWEIVQYSWPWISHGNPLFIYYF